MAHMTKKKLEQRDRNNRNRGFNGFNTGVRSMGFVSNQQRKSFSHAAAWKGEY